jgi:hypothetical protein
MIARRYQNWLKNIIKSDNVTDIDKRFADGAYEV